VLTLMGGSWVNAYKGQKQNPETPIHRERIEWCNVWLTDNDQTDLPRVLLVGDSITQQYYENVSQQMSGKVYCGRLTTSACVADPVFELQLRSVLEQYQFDVIHFNNGLHGVDYTEPEYRQGYQRALTLIREKQPAAKMIVALSTPTRPGGPKADLIPRMEARNRIARQLAETVNAPVNDLFTPMQNHPEYYRDEYHFRGDAIKIQSKQVAGAILEILDS